MSDVRLTREPADNLIDTDEIPDDCCIATDQDLAKAMALAATQKSLPGQWLDPCVGNGSLVLALQEAGVSATDIHAVDQRQVPSLEPVEMHRADFITWSNRIAFSNVIANPPYLAIERLRGKHRRAASDVSDCNGQKIGANSNYWVAFIWKALRHLSKRGSLCFVLPAAYEYARYGANIRETLPRLFEEFWVVRSIEPLFGDVLDGSIVVVGKGFLQAPRIRHSVTVRRRRDLLRTLLRLGQMRPRKVRAGGRLNGVLLKNVANVRIGCVTGDNNFFVFGERHRRDMRLPLSAVVPVFSRASHLGCVQATKAHWVKLRDSGERIWLFHPSDAALENPFVQEYILLGSRGACRLENYKIAKRSPWHKVTLGAAPDLIVSGMSSQPLLVVNSFSRLRVTNTLYSIEMKQGYEHWSSYVALAFLTSGVREQLRSLTRRYPGGLSKLEPSDLGSVMLPNCRERTPDLGLLERAAQKFLAGDARGAADIAEPFLEGASELRSCALIDPHP
jgi:adenine-specific DNA-methyltransferase